MSESPPVDERGFDDWLTKAQLKDPSNLVIRDGNDAFLGILFRDRVLPHDAYFTPEENARLRALWEDGYSEDSAVETLRREQQRRTCYGCLVDGMDHNCGYTGF